MAKARSILPKIPYSIARSRSNFPIHWKSRLTGCSTRHARHRAWTTPNIAKVHEAGKTDDGRFFVVMEYIDGKSLASVLESGPMAVQAARTITSQVLDGLDEAHRHGLVHRDIKPTNIMLTARGGAKVLDFGLAKRSDALPPAGDTTQTIDQGRTPAGIAVGTPPYMSPEQLRGEPLDGRSDLFLWRGSLRMCNRSPALRGQGRNLNGRHPASDSRSSIAVDSRGEGIGYVLSRALKKRPEDRLNRSGNGGGCPDPVIS